MSTSTLSAAPYRARNILVHRAIEGFPHSGISVVYIVQSTKTRADIDKITCRLKTVATALACTVVVATVQKSTKARTKLKK